MHILDHDGRALLGRRQQRFGGDAYAAVGPVSATDDTQSLQLTIDAAGRVVSVWLIDDSGLRSPEALASVVQQAYTAADAARFVATLEATGQLDDPDARQAFERGDALVVRRPRPDVRREVLLAESPDLDVALLEAPSTTRGTSDNGYLSVTLDEAGAPCDVEADPHWLAAAHPDAVQGALLQAFAAADPEVG